MKLIDMIPDKKLTPEEAIEIFGMGWGIYK